ncbi:hypothetical protein AB6A40_001264 [Gnathostoma spinigerum]|uniref:Uncharacterized protein n=1 Tax=Gnathostoma spinigerum TaxID=75299 RepID=A0ABD6E3T1_9BILA
MRSGRKTRRAMRYFLVGAGREVLRKRREEVLASKYGRRPRPVSRRARRRARLKARRQEMQRRRKAAHVAASYESSGVLQVSVAPQTYDGASNRTVVMGASLANEDSHMDSRLYQQADVAAELAQLRELTRTLEAEKVELWEGNNTLVAENAELRVQIDRLKQEIFESGIVQRNLHHQTLFLSHRNAELSAERDYAMYNSWVIHGQLEALKTGLMERERENDVKNIISVFPPVPI